MDLNLTTYYNEASTLYKSMAQQARRMTEKWAADNLYCPKCGRSLNQYPNNTPVYDFYCNHSNEKVAVISATRDNFQLKSGQNFPDNNFPDRIQGAEYNTTFNSLKQGTFPSLILLHYEKQKHIVKDVLLLHRLSITLSCIKPRNPLNSTAQRKGWQGCIISLDKIPQIGRIRLVNNSKIVPKNLVLYKWAYITKLLKGDIIQRGWTADIINFIEQLPRRFTLSDLYKYENQLIVLHPQNKHVKDKIRQQLQILRDRGFIRFKEPGMYEKVSNLT